MIIKDIKTERKQVDLKKPFKTALRTATSIETIIVKIYTDDNIIGYGAAAPTEVITGETTESIISAINYLKKYLIGKNLLNSNRLFYLLNSKIENNTSAKAAIDIAIYDLLAKNFNLPLYKYLGGGKKELITDLTISLNTPNEMVKDCKDAVKLGFKTLKIKLGDDLHKDLKRLKAINQSINSSIKFRIDANQAWKPKEAIKIINYMRQENINIELVEQPVYYKDLEGLKYVTQNVNVPILADEAVYSPKDAMKIITMRAADMLNIKLMKTGGIYNALKIAKLAEINNIDCMIGCMMENSISVSAAAHLSASQKIIRFNDLDVPSLIKNDGVNKKIVFENEKVILNKSPGIGVNL